MVEISYDGTNYSGWQIQPNAPSIQETIQKQLFTLYGTELGIIGCGRTDAGVHARQYFFHVELTSDRYSVDQLTYKLNQLLPSDIAVKSIVESQLHARFDAVWRHYEYHLHFDKSPFLDRFSYHLPYATHLDLRVLQDLSSTLLEFTDFATFCKTNSDVNSTICHLNSCEWLTSETGLIFRISADRFLRGMVRLIVGASINLGKAKISLDQLVQGLEKKQRLELNWSVPPEGLSLTKVEYP